jgi:L-ascorbate metabolism protein UlaG (beta-lactamase superfamily)
MKPSSTISAVRVRKLSWAGVEISADGARLVLDPLEHTEPLRDFLGPPRHGTIPVATDGSTWAAVTHVHPDHCDGELLRRLPPGRVMCHAPIGDALASDGIQASTARLWQPLEAGPFRLTALPSHDWRGDDQVAWMVEAHGHRLIHCGDTIWHGGWYEIARRYAPFGVAFLPINGVRVRLAGFTATDVPATLDPEQAIEAAVVLGASSVVAIHRGLFHNPPTYVEQHDAQPRMQEAASRRQVHVLALNDGQGVELPHARVHCSALTAPATQAQRAPTTRNVCGP